MKGDVSNWHPFSYYVIEIQALTLTLTLTTVTLTYVCVLCFSSLVLSHKGSLV